MKNKIIISSIFLNIFFNLSNLYSISNNGYNYPKGNSRCDQFSDEEIQKKMNYYSNSNLSFDEKIKSLANNDLRIDCLRNKNSNCNYFTDAEIMQKIDYYKNYNFFEGEIDTMLAKQDLTVNCLEKQNKINNNYPWWKLW